MFNGTLDNYKRSDYTIELKQDAKPYHAWPFPTSNIHQHTLKKEVQKLVKMQVLKKINNSQWASPTFVIPKKSGTVRLISDFRELNKRIRRKLIPIHKIQDLIFKLEGFKYATSLNLVMEYYHITSFSISSQLCTIDLPWDKYKYHKLTM